MKRIFKKKILQSLYLLLLKFTMENIPVILSAAKDLDLFLLKFTMENIPVILSAAKDLDLFLLKFTMKNVPVILSAAKDLRISAGRPFAMLRVTAITDPAGQFCKEAQL